MRRPLLFSAAMVVVLTCAFEAEAAEPHDADKAFLGFTLFVPTTGTLACDLAVAIGLSNEGRVKRGWAITGIVFSGVETLAGLSIMKRGSELGHEGYRTAGVAFTLFGAASLAFALYGLSKPAFDLVAPAGDGFKLGPALIPSRGGVARGFVIHRGW
jgi:hypothetical protein